MPQLLIRHDKIIATIDDTPGAVTAIPSEAGTSLIDAALLERIGQATSMGETQMFDALALTDARPEPATRPTKRTA